MPPVPHAHWLLAYYIIFELLGNQDDELSHRDWLTIEEIRLRDQRIPCGSVARVIVSHRKF
jgi:hypothetical protein